MAATRTKYKDNYTFLHQEWLCDTDADIVNLPTDAQAGSTAIILSDSENGGGMSVLITDNDGVWHRA